MQRLTGLPRAIASLSGVWFVLFTLLPGSLRPCPMHPGAHGSPAPMEMAGHHHHAPTPPMPDAHDGCDCLVTCCAFPAMPAEPAPIVARVVALPHLPPASATPSLAPTRARLLPFANGPPVLPSS
ncbi:MAG: hypothetical protein KA226_10670 [Gemmatimonadales bacterium]|nr:hypothetical protein [Gemmatimonadota bacterium]MBP6571874.1 hypothetical protein [Gemmatimonadales bacterium]MBP9898235.1 hypothetical protein [Gemmatimonadales bacterium]